MAVTGQHDDFGEKIGGARKDIWQKRGLYSDDLSLMNEREADKYVKKDNIWKKPDYQAMIDGGIPFDVVYFIKKVRDSTSVAPIFLRTDDTSEKRTARQMEYIDTIRDLQSVMETVKTKADALETLSRFFVGKGYMSAERGVGNTYYQRTDKGRNNPAITDKLFHAMCITSPARFDYEITRKAVKEQFGVPKDKQIPKGYEVRYNDGKNTYSKNGDWKPDTWYVTKGHRILKTNFTTEEDALRWTRDFVKEQAAGGKKRFLPPQLASIRRNGPDYRQGRNIEGSDYMRDFGFKGGEFGNWMSQDDRQASLNFGYDALKDLAAALKINDRDISYQGELSIAFGARGSGNAVAHYEPTRQVINLTKMRGAGSLAHEWWHGFDDYMGRKLGIPCLLSERPAMHPLFSKLIDTIKYKPESPERAAVRSAKQSDKTRRNAESWLNPAVLPFATKSGDETLATYEKLKDEFLNGKPGSVEQINDFKKSISGRVIPKAERDRLLLFEDVLHSMAEKPEPVTLRVDTDYYRNSKEMGRMYEKEGGYWDSNVEMTARAFATYIMDVLPNRSDYLAGHAECAINFTADENGELSILKAYPEGDERKAINAVFDEIIAELKLQNHLTHDEHTSDGERGVSNECVSSGDGQKTSVLKTIADARETAKTRGKDDKPEKNKSKTHDAEH